MSSLATVCLVLSLAAVLIPAGVHVGFRAPRVRESGTPAEYGLDFEAVRIPTVRDRRLFAWLLPAPGSARAVVALHGWGGNAQLMLPIAAPLQRGGINVLLLDARNHGASDSDTFSSLPRFAEDLGKAIDWLKQNQPQRARRIAVLGHSVGAGAALFEASRRSDIAAVISIAAFAHPAEVNERYLRPLRLPRPLVRLVSRYVEWLIGYRFDAIAPVNTVRRVTCPVLVVHGTDDRVVPVDDARRIASHHGERPIDVLEVEGAGHDSVEKIEAHADVLLRFLERHWA